MSSTLIEILIMSAILIVYIELGSIADNINLLQKDVHTIVTQKKFYEDK